MILMEVCFVTNDLEATQQALFEQQRLDVAMGLWCSFMNAAKKTKPGRPKQPGDGAKRFAVDQHVDNRQVWGVQQQQVVVLQMLCGKGGLPCGRRHPEPHCQFFT